MASRDTSSQSLASRAPAKPDRVAEEAAATPPPPPPAAAASQPPVAGQAQETAATGHAQDSVAGGVAQPERSPGSLAESVTLSDAKRRRLERTAMAKAAQDPHIITAPDSNTRYTLRERQIFRSADGGATETLELKDAGATLTAGVAPDSEICWVVGEDGVVWRRDAGGWHAVPLREKVALGSVEAGDARSARVRATDGRVFGTTDGGVTWRAMR
jgi:hypothetical protein